MTPTVDLAKSAAIFIASAYDEFDSAFSKITARAPERFRNRDWPGMAEDAEERLGIYGEAARRTAAAVADLLGDRHLDKSIWTAIRAAYSESVSGRLAVELAETFFNSVTRRTFTTIGVDRDIEFVDVDRVADPAQSSTVFSSWVGSPDIGEVVTSVLVEGGLASYFADLEADLASLARRIEREVGSRDFMRVDMATDIFFRGKGAYLVGRLFLADRIVPMAIALVHKKNGVLVDAVLLTERDVSVLFSFAHSYFHVAESAPEHLVTFIRELVPRKRRSELYISVGRARHGKTELYRELRRHLHTSDDTFVRPPGKEGLVMSVFTLPGFEMVFKVIKDAFPPQKTMTPSQVMDKYRLVYRHDRAGRLVDSQSFEHLEFGVEQFAPGLLESLLEECSRSVRLNAGKVDLNLTYVQRRVVPLDVYLRTATSDQASRAVIDYGNAIRDLAVTGIFPGDLLVKNFGVTRSDRIVFYDYDELIEITECRFREMPVARTVDDEMAATPWFPLGPDDIFPSEFGSFLGLKGDLREIFLKAHSSLLEAAWWEKIKKRVEKGEIVSIYPYDRALRLTPASQ